MDLYPVTPPPCASIPVGYVMGITIAGTTMMRLIVTTQTVITPVDVLPAFDRYPIFFCFNHLKVYFLNNGGNIYPLL